MTTRSRRALAALLPGRHLGFRQGHKEAVINGESATHHTEPADRAGRLGFRLMSVDSAHHQPRLPTRPSPEFGQALPLHQATLGHASIWPRSYNWQGLRRPKCSFFSRSPCRRSRRSVYLSPYLNLTRVTKSLLQKYLILESLHGKLTTCSRHTRHIPTIKFVILKMSDRIIIESCTIILIITMKK